MSSRVIEETGSTYTKTNRSRTMFLPGLNVTKGSDKITEVHIERSMKRSYPLRNQVRKEKKKKVYVFFSEIRVLFLFRQDIKCYIKFIKVILRK